VKELFETIDRSNDGVISKDEFIEFYMGKFTDLEDQKVH